MSEPPPTPRNINRGRTVLEEYRKHAASDKRPFASGSSEDTRLCPSCRKPAAGKKGGLVIGCGSSFFHVDCYKCKKCQQRITVDDRVFLDFDGLPLCENCFHKCNACHLPIAEKIIYVDEQSFYHPECFKCKKCERVLDDRKFAKTSRSFYCLVCHERRIIKIKKHEEKLAQKAYGGLFSPEFKLEPLTPLPIAYANP